MRRQPSMNFVFGASTCTSLGVGLGVRSTACTRTVPSSVSPSYDDVRVFGLYAWLGTSMVYWQMEFLFSLMSQPISVVGTRG